MTDFEPLITSIEEEAHRTQRAMLEGLAREFCRTTRLEPHECEVVCDNSSPGQVSFYIRPRRDKLAAAREVPLACPACGGVAALIDPTSIASLAMIRRVSTAGSVRMAGVNHLRVQASCCGALMLLDLGRPWLQLVPMTPAAGVDPDDAVTAPAPAERPS